MRIDWTQDCEIEDWDIWLTKCLIYVSIQIVGFLLLCNKNIILYCIAWIWYWDYFWEWDILKVIEEIESSLRRRECDPT
jgi:hypothetical protein